MKKNKLTKNIKFILSASLVFGACLNSFAQSNFKESSNHFALYTQNGELKNLENAKKFIDQTYKTRRDSSSSRVNILRGMIYSSLAYVDSTRSLKYEKDPIEEAYVSLHRLKNRDRENNTGEISYIYQNLAASHIYKANKALENGDFQEAYTQFEEVNKINPNSENILNNLAMLAFQANNLDKSEEYYKIIIEQGNYTDRHFLQLAEIYKRKKDQQKEIETLKKGRALFPESKEVLFKLLEIYSQTKNYAAIAANINEAIKFEPENIELNYLAGYANETQKNIDEAKQFYKKVISLDENNYEANLALGLIELNYFLEDKDDLQAQYNAQEYLLKANEIKPYEIRALKALAIYYENSEDDLQLDRVNLLLNQLTNN